MKKVWAGLVVAVAALYGFYEQNPELFGSLSTPQYTTDQRLADAYEARQSDIQVRGSGIVSRVLSDDNKGSRHQRFILELASGQKLLVAHNIDLAPRIANLRKGDSVDFNGEYEWNDKGGVLHWTHHDPGGRHEDGWLKHKGVTYQ